MNNATELLRRALDALIAQDETIYAEFCGSQNWRSPPIIEEIRAYLDAEPEAEPVGLIHSDGTFELLSMDEINLGEIIPLYTSPEPKRKPMTEDEEDEAFNSASKWVAWLETENRMLREARKPMTDEEIVDEFGIPRSGTYFIEGVFAGVRFAEKHHGIIPCCENS